MDSRSARDPRAATRLVDQTPGSPASRDCPQALMLEGGSIRNWIFLLIPDHSIRFIHSFFGLYTCPGTGAIRRAAVTAVIAPELRRALRCPRRPLFRTNLIQIYKSGKENSLGRRRCGVCE